MPAANTPRVSVLVVSWNARPLLERCLPSVAATDHPDFEVVLVDNGSTDDSVAWVTANLPTVRILQLEDNLGFCGGNNRGIEATDGEFVVLLNNDVEVEPDWLTHLVARVDSDPSIAAVQPKLLQFGDRGTFEYAGAAGGHLDRLGYPFARGRLFFDLETDRGQYDEPADVFWATGAALLLRRSALETVGLLDEAFEFHMEEIDLCWRLRRAGYRVMTEPRAKAYHIGGGSLAQTSPRKTRYNFRNSLLMLYKNLPPSGWLRVFPQRILMDGLAILRFVARAEFSHAAAVLQAYWQAHRMKGAYSPPSRAESIPPSYRKSIVLDYYLRGRKTFGQLDPGDFRP
ncbi:MAG: glycosyltransferase family 2 protein [Rhodothermales bacterium]|nr:glycosyltransferase family 2 protein [Rhodothermales bacterium]